MNQSGRMSQYLHASVRAGDWKRADDHRRSQFRPEDRPNAEPARAMRLTIARMLRTDVRRA